MNITLPLQPQEEAKLIAIAQAKGLSADALISRGDRQHSRRGAVESSGVTSVFQKEQGVWVLRTGQPIGAAVVENTLNSIRQERDLSSMGPLR
jgi:hypothetical protein